MNKLNIYKMGRSTNFVRYFTFVSEWAGKYLWINKLWAIFVDFMGTLTPSITATPNCLIIIKVFKFSANQGCWI